MFSPQSSREATVFLHPALCQRRGSVGASVIERGPLSFIVAPDHEVLSEQLPRNNKVEEAND